MWRPGQGDQRGRARVMASQGAQSDQTRAQWETVRLDLNNHYFIKVRRYLHSRLIENTIPVTFRYNFEAFYALNLPTVQL